VPLVLKRLVQQEFVLAGFLLNAVPLVSQHRLTVCRFLALLLWFLQSALF